MDQIRSQNAFPEELRKTTTASEDFKKNLLSCKRYVDKTQVLIPLLEDSHETTFFLRPRRFGKTLTLSMLRYYLEDTRDEALNAENRKLFEGMKIMHAGAFYTSKMTSFPVINLTFQGIKGNTFEEAYGALVRLIQRLYNEHQDVLDSERLSKVEKKYFQQVWTGQDPVTSEKTSIEDYTLSLKHLTLFLRKVYGKRTVVLIDEYDVPLEKAYQGEYYPKMINVISSLLQNVLKTNSENLQFAVVTGCLRIAKESIYTGLNNPDINTVMSYQDSDVFGFTEDEVQELLKENGLVERIEDVKSWYDGYIFGKTVIYNPWSVIKFIENAKAGDPAEPREHWGNTSSNDILRELAANGSRAVKDKVEQLLRGETIQFAFSEHIVYSEISYQDDNIFNIMLSTGYLTATSFDGKMVTAKIPNKEVETIFEDQIKAWFDGHVRQSLDVQRLYQAIRKGDVDGAMEFQTILKKEILSAISFYDTQEAFYHGMLITLMASNQDYMVSSNREAGLGRFDVESKFRYDLDDAFILEVKVASSPSEMAKLAGEAARQIEQRKYVTDLLREGYEKVYTYGIAFFGKTCRVFAGPVYTQLDLDRLLSQDT
ncbi:MAG: AAA family ATPase [Clostridia bacterium]|nr:AAA family ATPase [Clostridia bacterium]